jgi:parallel beta-helix repeat protein
LKKEIRIIIIAIISLSLLWFSFFLDLNTETKNKNIWNQYYKSSISTESGIEIDGNIELASLASEGNGSESNPFILENHYITTSNANGNGFELRNTDAYVIVRKNAVIDAENYGFYFKNVTRAIVENNEATLNINGNFVFYLTNNITIRENHGYFTSSIPYILDHHDFLFEFSNYNQIINNSASLSEVGFNLITSHSNVLINNTSTNNREGVTISASNNNVLSNNIVKNAGFSGFYLKRSINTLINGNDLNGNGFFLSGSKNNTIINNKFTSTGIVLQGKDVSDFKQTKIENNSIDKKTIVYLQNESNKTVSGNIAQIILFNCSNIIIRDITMENSVNLGIQLIFSDKNSIISNEMGYNINTGIQLLFSSENKLTNNVLNSQIGINLDKAKNISILNNRIDGQVNINLENSFGNTISNNALLGEYYGIKIMNSTGNYVSHNQIATHNNQYPTQACIEVQYSQNNTFRNNTLKDSKNGYYIYKSNKNEFKNNFISENTYGIQIEESDQNEIINNQISRNMNFGIYLKRSNLNNIQFNYLMKNTDYGIKLESSNNNSIYLNRFTANGGVKTQGFVDTNTNSWNDESKGNYWSDYDGMDQNQDDVGDTPYILDGGMNVGDNYPMLNEMDIINYFITKNAELTVSSTRTEDTGTKGELLIDENVVLMTTLVIIITSTLTGVYLVNELRNYGKINKEEKKRISFKEYLLAKIAKKNKTTSKQHLSDSTLQTLEEIIVETNEEKNVKIEEEEYEINR